MNQLFQKKSYNTVYPASIPRNGETLRVDKAPQDNIAVQLFLTPKHSGTQVISNSDTTSGVTDLERESHDDSASTVMPSNSVLRGQSNVLQTLPKIKKQALMTKFLRPTRQ